MKWKAAIEPGGQGREHAFLARTLGVNQIIVALNKMDDAGFQESRYKEAKEAVEKMLKLVGYNTAKINFIPISGWKGDNLAKKSENMPWYKGPTLAESLDILDPPEKPVGKPLRIPIQDVYSITGVGTVPVGRVETGKMKPGEKVIVMPSGAAGEIKSIETHHTQLESAEAGDNVGFNLRGVDKKQIKRGDIIGAGRQSAIGCQGVRGPSDRDSPSNSNRSGIYSGFACAYCTGGCDNLAVHLKN